MRIGIDMDEVIADHTGSFNAFHDNKYGTDLANMVLSEFYLHKLIDVTPEEEREHIWEYYGTEDFRKMQPIQGSVEAVKKLALDHELYVITSRPGFVAQESQDWLERYFPGCFKKFIILNHRSGDAKAKSKAEACAENNVDIMVEDLADYANDCASVCKQVFLIEKPWNNRKAVSSNVVRAKSWDEILDLVSNL